MVFKCPICGCDDPDSIIGMGENMLFCESCENDFHELELMNQESWKK